MNPILVCIWIGTVGAAAVGCFLLAMIWWDAYNQADKTVPVSIDYYGESGWELFSVFPVMFLSPIVAFILSVKILVDGGI